MEFYRVRFARNSDEQVTNSGRGWGLDGVSAEVVSAHFLAITAKKEHLTSPTGFRPKAQGCAAALPWVTRTPNPQPQTGLRPVRHPVHNPSLRRPTWHSSDTRI